MTPRFLTLLVCLNIFSATTPPLSARPSDGPIRVLFLGHDSKHHPSNLYYPLLAKALGRDAIYFDYHSSVEKALGDADYLNHFDVVLLYANHEKIAAHQWKNLLGFVENGGGFVPVHCASACFGNEPGFDQLVGARFAHHKTAVLRSKTILPDHAAINGVPEFEAWDETYVHKNHNEEGRTVLQVREVTKEDNITEPEAWTWIRTQGKGRVFYTASGHDHRVWEKAGFHELLKHGILWSAGEKRQTAYQTFLDQRTPLTYKKTADIPNYENRPEPLPKQKSLSPEDSLKYTAAPVEFRIELFAAEPDIVNPICLAWDERGRLWVAETVDYPNEVRSGSGNDSIKILEDSNGDGRCDKVTVFASGLNIPTSLTFWNGGIIVAQAPDFLFLKDEDGDDKADVKTTLFTGWGTVDTHAGPSNLRYGLDNWIYGAVGYSAFKGKLGGKQQRFGSGIFRFQPDGSEIEFLYQFNNNTWGLGFNAAGDVFGSTANANPSFYGGLPATVYDKGQQGQSAKMIADTAIFDPVTPNIRQVDALGSYTAGAGHALATSANFPLWYRDHVAFVAGPTGNLLGRFELSRRPNQSGYRSKNSANMLASADEWFSPVAAEIGPDGNLWVADWYNFIIQHNPTPTPERGGYLALKGKGNAHINPNRDRQHGRIYRVIWEEAKASKITSLAGASDAELVAALGNDNQFWRLTAQRLLVAGKKNAALPALKEAVKNGGLQAIHALWTLEGLGALDHDTHLRALLSKSNDLKRNAIRALGNDAESVQLFFDTPLVTDKDPQVRLAAFTKLAHFPKSESVKLAAGHLMKLAENRDDEWLALALKTAGAKQGARGPAKLGPNLLPNPSFEELTEKGDLPKNWAVRTYRGEAHHQIDNKIARTGKHSVRISSAKGADSSFYASTSVKPNTLYRMSGWIRTRGISGARGAQMNVHEIQGTNSARTKGLQKKNDWIQVAIDFQSGDRNKISINTLYGGWGLSTGTAWWDDVAIQEVTYETIDPTGNAITEGNAANGKKIFHQHPIAACIRCHMLEGKGGPIGPPLDGIASRKEPDYILKSLIDPTAEIAEGFQAEVSPMPPMGVLLKPQELADVIAYLATLKE